MTAERIGDWGPWLGIDPDTKERTHIAHPVWYPAGDMERAIVFQPGYRTDRQTYGRHGMDITWLLRGPRGVTQFKMFSGWEPGQTRHEVTHGPMGADVGYHALCPQYEGAESFGRMDCEYLPDRQFCYYDGSGLAADELMAEFFIHGEDVIWRTLSERHDDLIVPGEARS